ncbi:hypothetical protein CIK04_21275, partial [Vibrio sp. 03_296]
ARWKTSSNSPLLGKTLDTKYEALRALMPWLSHSTSHLAPRTSIFAFKLNLANVSPTFCARIAPILLFLRFNTFLETT